MNRMLALIFHARDGEQSDDTHAASPCDMIQYAARALDTVALVHAIQRGTCVLKERLMQLTH